MANQDIAAFKCYDGKAFLEMFFVRGSKMIGRQHYFFENLNDFEKVLLNPQTKYSSIFQT